MKLTNTRHTAATGIVLAHILPEHWQHVDTNDGNKAQVGPIYKTKIEALADHEDYMQRAGWLGCMTPDAPVLNNPNFFHYVVRTGTNHIVAAFDYSVDAHTFACHDPLLKVVSRSELNDIRPEFKAR